MLESRSLESLEHLLRNINILMVGVAFMSALIMLVLGVVRQTVDDVRREKAAAKVATEKAEMQEREAALRSNLESARAEAKAAEVKAEEATRQAARIEDAQRARRLTDQQKARMTEAFRPFAGSTVRIAFSNNEADTPRLAADFSEAFAAAGVNIEVRRFGMMVPPPIGYTVYVRDRNALSPSARVIIDLLGQMGSAPRVQPTPEAPATFELLVGGREIRD